MKLHWLFSLARFKRLQTLPKDAGMGNKEILEMSERVIDACEVCVKYKKPHLRPVLVYQQPEFPMKQWLWI